MSTAFLRTAFSSSSSVPTANNWNSGSISSGNIGLNFPTGVAYGNGVYVATGVGGYSSGDQNYSSPNSFTQKSLKYTSNYILTWSNPTTNLDFINFTRIRFLNNRFLAIGFDGVGNAYVCQSTDGDSWTKQTIFTGASSSNYPIDIAWNGTYYIVSASGLANGYRSTDLTTWTNFSFPNYIFPGALIYGNGIFVLLGQFQVITSSDGISWATTNLTLPNRPRDVIYANSQFVACCTAGTTSSTSLFLTSPDAITWTTRTSPTTGAKFFAIIYVLSKYISVGTNFNLNFSIINTSSDGVSWTEYSPGGAASRGLTFDGTNIFVIGNANSFTTSTNTTTWIAGSTTIGQLLCVANGTNSNFFGAGNTMFVAGGNAPASGLNATVIYSYDGFGWSKGNISGGSFGQNLVGIKGIVYSNGRFITNTGLISTDGINWTTTTSFVNNSSCLITTSVTNLLYASWGSFGSTFDANIYKSTNNGSTWTIDFSSTQVVGQMAYGAGRVVACSQATGTVLVNPNLGVGWFSYNTGLFAPRFIVYANGKFYIISRSTAGNSTYRYGVSVNGESWTTGAINIPIGLINDGVSINSLVYKNGLYVIALRSGASGRPAYVMTSTDGINYSVVLTSPTSGNIAELNALSYSPTTFTTVGYAGTTPFIYFSTS
jgi:hypothetical protein